MVKQYAHAWEIGRGWNVKFKAVLMTVEPIGRVIIILDEIFDEFRFKELKLTLIVLSSLKILKKALVICGHFLSHNLQ